jgi:hypothetical protein
MRESAGQRMGGVGVQPYLGTTLAVLRCRIGWIKWRRRAPRVEATDPTCTTGQTCESGNYRWLLHMLFTGVAVARVAREQQPVEI